MIILERSCYFCPARRRNEHLGAATIRGGGLQTFSPGVVVGRPLVEKFHNKNPKAIF